MSLTMRTKLFAGSALVCFALAGLVLFVVERLSASMALTARMVDVRAPMAQYAAEVRDGLSSSVSSLRAYMQQRDEKYKAERRQLWEKVIEPGLASMKSLARRSAVSGDSLRLAEIEIAGRELRVAEEEVEAICHKPENSPAEKLFFEQATPLAGEMIDALSRMISDEFRADDQPFRKPLLKEVMDARSQVGDCMANLRAYFPAAEGKYRTASEAALAGVVKAFSTMKKDKSRLSPAQRAAFNRFTVALHGFEAMPDRIFKIRSEEGWNVAAHRMATEIAPALARLQRSMSAIIDDHQALMHGESRAIRASIGSLTTLLWIFLACGVGCSAIVAFSMIRSVVLPLHTVADGASALAAGNLDHELSINGAPEFARISTSFNALLDMLREKADVAARVAAGDLSANIRLASHADRLGQSMALMIASLREMRQSIAPLLSGSRATGEQVAVSRAVQETLDAMRSSMRDAAAVLEQVASGNFVARFERQEHSEFVAIREVLNEAVGILDAEFSRIAARTARVAEFSQGFHGRAGAFAEKASLHLETAFNASAAMDKLASGFAEDGAKVESARQAVENLKTGADRQSEQLDRLAAGLSRLKAGVEESAKIFKTLKDMGMQARILSVNAAIEAAHAGEAGKSFAAVAGQLGNLATQSAAVAEASETAMAVSSRFLETGCEIRDALLRRFSEAGERIQQANDLLAELAGIARARKQDFALLKTSIDEVRESGGSIVQEANGLTAAAATMRAAAGDLQRDFKKFRFTIVEDDELIFTRNRFLEMQEIPSLAAPHPDAVVETRNGDSMNGSDRHRRGHLTFSLDDGHLVSVAEMRSNGFTAANGKSESPVREPANAFSREEDGRSAVSECLVAEIDEEMHSACRQDD
jgi:methyl-accepting chemotaxis protein